MSPLRRLAQRLVVRLMQLWRVDIHQVRKHCRIHLPNQLPAFFLSDSKLNGTYTSVTFLPVPVKRS